LKMMWWPFARPGRTLVDSRREEQGHGIVSASCNALL
jgi:hypothetical protein